MNTKELRQGNYLQGMSIIKVESIIDGKVNGYYTSGFDGIPLTEEMLLKCGFELYYESQFCKRYELILNTEICYAFSNVEDYRGAVGFSYVGKVIQNIKFVHQLQNLYFALTGQELEINL